MCVLIGREDGELGTFTRFSSCTFEKNTGMRYGSAIGATALNLFESKEETKPAEINNWLVIVIIVHSITFYNGNWGQWKCPCRGVFYGEVSLI